MAFLSKINTVQLEKEILKFRDKPIILDTGPLTFLLIGLCDSAKKNDNDIWQGHTKNEFLLLLTLTKKFPNITITPEVLAECTNLLKRDISGDKYSFILNRIIEPLKNFGEVYVEKDVILNYSEFSRFGPTDVSLIECSKRTQGLILTQDSDFKRHCYSNLIPVLNFNELRPLVWE